MHYHWKQAAAKEKERNYIEQCTSTRKRSTTLTVVALNKEKTIFLVSLYLLNLRDLFGVGTKLKESVFKNNNPINSTITATTRIC